jgi:hypothetical protein
MATIHAHARTLTLICLATLAALAAGLLLAPSQLSLRADDPALDVYLSDFRGLERNQTASFRWSMRRAALLLPGLERHALLLDMRLSSSRPPDAPRADLTLVRGRWQSPPLLIGPDWRRYQVLLPPAEDGAAVALRVPTFSPNDRDRLGVALGRLQISPASADSPAILAARLLGVWLGALLLAPLLVFLVALRLGVAGRRTIWPLLASALAIGLVGLAASQPIGVAARVPETWMLPLAFALGGALWAALRQPARGGEWRAGAWLRNARARMALLALIALLQGGLFVFLLPPWQHYDEPAHFEFAWLIANHPTWPVPGTTDPRISPIGGAGRALFHQPLYHLLVSLPLRLVASLDLTAQLYVARLVSLALFVTTIICAARTVDELTEPGHPLRWGVPLATLLLPTYADMMTAVNNDVGAIAIGSWFFLQATRLIMRGPTPRRTLVVAGVALLGSLTKNTDVVLVPLGVLAWLIAVGVRRGWRWRWPLIGMLGGALLVALLTLTPGEPAYWYRWGRTTLSAAPRETQAAAPFGAQALRLEGVGTPNFEGFSNPLAPSDLPQVADRRVTVGAWVWASRPVRAWGPGVIFNNGARDLSSAAPEIALSTTPTFVAMVFDVPQRVSSLQYMAWAVTPGDAEPAVIYYDGAVMALGERPLDTPPVFDTPAAAAGEWGGERFENLVRNPTIEQGWLRVRPEVDALTAYYIRRSPSQIVASLLDPERTGPIMADAGIWLAFASFGTFAWSQVFLDGVVWQYLFPLLLVALLPGPIAWLAWGPRRRRQPLTAAVLFLALGGLAVWGVVVLRILPALAVSPPPFARYAFPAIAPTMIGLMGGWGLLWRPEARARAALLFVGGMLLLNLLAIQTIARFFRSACVESAEACLFVPLPSLSEQPLFLLALLLVLLAALGRTLWNLTHAS